MSASNVVKSPHKPTETASNILFIDDRDDGRRIDNFLIYKLKSVPKKHIYKVIRRGEVRVNGSRCRADYRLAAGDKVRLPPPLVEPRGPAQVPHISAAVTSEIRQAILFENEHLLILNKPSGIAVHSGTGLRWGLIDVLRQLYPDEGVLELVHRLDRETSGVLVVARSAESLKELNTLIRTRRLEKRYVALVEGRWPLQRTELSDRMTRNPHRVDKKVEIDDDGIPAHAIFTPRSFSASATLVDVELITGRTHQIRVQSSAAGHPIAGDGKYGNVEFNEQMAALGLNRLFLHASDLRFEMGGNSFEFSAPLSVELQRVVTQLE